MKRLLSVLAVTFLALSVSAQPSETAPELARARELSELDWTPLHDIQLRGKTDRRVKALKPMHGMLYSSASQGNCRVPYDKSLYTFLTCLHNPYSLLYTESRNPYHERSAYGFDYNGGNTSGPWMGCVCSIFSSYVAGFEFQYASAKHLDLCNRGILSRPEDQSAQGVQLFDILWQEGHCRAVTDITRSADGTVTAVEISESVSPVVKRKTYSAAQFDSLMDAKKMVIYHRENMSAQGQPPVYYMPSPLVYNDAICTFAGDRVCFMKGDRIIIHCLDRTYRNMELYRNGKLIKTIKLTGRMLVNNEMLGIRGNTDFDPGAYAVDLTDMDLGYGKYEACLVRGTRRSEPTEFEIVECSVSYEDGKVYFSCEGAEPIFWSKSNRHYVISTTEHDRGYVKSGNVTTKSKIVVTFQGEYGRVSRKLVL